MGPVRASQAAERFATGQVARIVGVPPRRLRKCVGVGLVAPPRNRRGHFQFRFGDLVVLRTIRDLLTHRVPVGRIWRLLGTLRRQLGDRQLQRLSVYAEKGTLIAFDGTRRWQPESGQLLFDFSTRAAGAHGLEKVAPLRRRELRRDLRPTERRPSADEWYDLGSEMEGDSPHEAKVAYSHALEADPSHVPTHINMGCLLHAECLMDEAELHYREAIRLEPASGLAWYNLGVLLEDVGRPDQARGCYERAVAAEADFADAHYNLALLYEASGRQQDAFRHLAVFRRLTRVRR